MPSHAHATPEPEPCCDRTFVVVEHEQVFIVLALRDDERTHQQFRTKTVSKHEHIRAQCEASTSRTAPPLHPKQLNARVCVRVHASGVCVREPSWVVAAPLRDKVP